MPRNENDELKSLMAALFGERKPKLPNVHSAEEIGLYLVALGECLRDGSIVEAKTVEQSAANDKAQIAALKRIGNLTDDQAEELFYRIDVTIRMDNRPDWHEIKAEQAEEKARYEAGPGDDDEDDFGPEDEDIARAENVLGGRPAFASSHPRPRDEGFEE